VFHVPINVKIKPFTLLFHAQVSNIMLYEFFYKNLPTFSEAFAGVRQLEAF